MELIKFYSEYDMTCGVNIENIIEFVKKFSDTDEESNINQILEYFNIIKFYNVKSFKDKLVDETKGKIDEVIKALHKRIGKFIGSNKSKNFLSLYNIVEGIYREDFCELVNNYNVCQHIKKSDFDYFLSNSNLHYSMLLKFDKIVNTFDDFLREYMLQDNESAEVLLRKYFYNTDIKKSEILLPFSLSEKDKEKIILNYIESTNPNPNYLEIIINYPSNNDLRIGDKLKLKAKRRYKEEIEKVFAGNSGIETGVMVKYPENQEEAVIYNYIEKTFECSVSRSWIENNLDFNTLLNNFIYIFEFFDRQMRLNLVSKQNEIGILERITIPDSKYLYKDASAFKYKDMMSTIQITSYVQVLNSYQIRLEEIIEWFFKNYLYEEFGIENYTVKMPTEASSNFEKCRAILPEIDSILKQYTLYLEDGEIDQELLQVSSSHLFFKDCISCIDQKYIYPMEETLFVHATYLLFSDQSGIFYRTGTDEKYKNFCELITNEKVKLSDFREFQINRIKWLIENRFLCEDEDGYLQFDNYNRVVIFANLYHNEVISYWRYGEDLRNEIDLLIKEGIFEFESTLFTRGEQDYLDYHLNKTKFGNSLDLRNSSLHGTQTSDDEQHKMNYIIFLKLVIIIITKINDDLCIRDTIGKDNK